MKSFWSVFNSGFLFFSLVAFIGGAIIVVSALKETLNSEQQMLLLLGLIFLILALHSFWGMVVEMSKNVIKSGERYDNLKRENKELKDDLKDMSASLRDVSAQLRVLIYQSGTQNNPLNFSGQEMYWCCKFCGTVNSCDDIMCKKCGMSKLSDDFSTVHEVPTVNEDDLNGWFCSYCMYENNDEDKVCARCGKPMISDTNTHRSK